MTNIVGFQAKGPIFCDKCGIRRDRGGYIVRQPIEGRFCSGEHARAAVEEAEEKKNKEG